MVLASVVHLNAAGLSIAFAAGFVSFVSPCVWPIVPAYLTYVSGVAFADLGDNARRVVTATGAFVLGFGTVFTLVGVGAGIAGSEFASHRRTLEIVGGVLVIVMGAVLAGFAPMGLLQVEKRLHLASKPAGVGGAYLAGLAFATGWTPCIGPTVTAIIALAASNGHALDGAILFGVYSLGLGVPFLLVGLFFTRAVAQFGALRRHSVTVMRLSGALLVVGGVLLATGELARLTGLLPSVGTI